MGKTKAQAAMEFLMTYGWALLVVLIAIGALAAFGVLTPGQSLPEVCLLGAGFACGDFKVEYFPVVGGFNKIQIKAINGMGKELDTFIIYIKEDSLLCPGYIGFIASPSSPPFKDGAAVWAVNFFPNDAGIACLDTPLTNPANCCTNPLIEKIGGEKICSVVGKCATHKPVLPGDKFKADLVIVYRESGSKILHRRIGSLNAKVEA